MNAERPILPTAGELRFDDLLRALLAERALSGWRVTLDPPWCRADPPAGLRRIQGWKLHVSATPLSTAVMLSRCVPRLLSAGVSFKFAATLEDVHALTDARCDRPSGGKVLTVYPGDDEQAVELAAILHEATLGLPGQEILSDQRYRPDSIVHYRFGAFAGITRQNLDGRQVSYLEAPDGSLVEDTRSAWFDPPSWAACPFAAEPAEPSHDQPPGVRTVLIADRFEVRAAITHANRGGVYRALDHQTGLDVIIKQARAHTGAQISGEDARDALRHEAAMLSALDGLAPRVVTIFDQDGDSFLVEGLVPGQTLRSWIADQIDASDSDPAVVPLDAGLDISRKLIELLSAVHDRGLVCRDFTPNNIMVRPDGELCLIDPELTDREGALVSRGHTPGFAPPEQAAADRFIRCPGPAVDRFSLGTTLFLLATGTEPLLLADRPEPRSPAERYAARLAAVGSPLAVHLTEVIVGLTAAAPESRWSLERARAALAPGRPVGGHPIPAPVTPIQRMIDDGIAVLLADLERERRRLWPSGPFGRLTDECAVQHGAGGVLGVLTYAAQAGHTELADTMAFVARWTIDRLQARERHLPGLYFGSAGAIWATYSCARWLGDGDLAERALAIARQLPVSWPIPDICHGAAGTGMTLLGLWEENQDDDLAKRVADCADGLLLAADVERGRIHWPIPEGIDSSLAGISHYGFAHGIAGIADFLLSAAAAFGREDWLAAAVRAGDTLLAAADRSLPGARWQTSIDGPPTAREFYYHWCSGSSGIGTFLLRLGVVTGGADYLAAAADAALAVHRTRWMAGTAACHGLPGGGEFLLDLAAASTGAARERYRAWAADLAAALYAQHAIRDDRLVLPDETGNAVTADAQTGLAGAVGFLLRLQQGGPRLWLADAAIANYPRTKGGDFHVTQSQ